MTLPLIAYLAGVLTILSPCILPVLPFVFARADRPFVTSTLPMLIGMAITFAGVATLAAIGGAWVVHANQAGRFLALALLIVFGLALLFPAFAERATAPLVALGNRLNNKANAQSASVGASLLLGVATGLLWAPCAGPILGLLLTTAAIQGANVQTSLLLLAYALGAATSLAVALFAGGRVFAALKRSLGAGEWIRRGLGAAVLAGAAAIALGLDTGLLARLSASSTERIERALLDMGGHEPDARMSADGQPAPSLEGGVAWLNSPPLTMEQLRGKVVLIDFWTYSCINCLRALPYVEAWADKYREHGLVVIGVHAPEFAFERDEGNVRRAMANLGVDYPVVLDNQFAIWRAYNNRYWPAHYFIDASGVIRHHRFGEGQYDNSERVIQELLREAGYDPPGGLVDPNAQGASAPASAEPPQSPETYIGYRRRENFVSAEQRTDAVYTYETPTTLQLNQWGLVGEWKVMRQSAELSTAGGAIRFRFNARDLHLVLAPGADGAPVRFRITIDGRAPGAAAGMDVNAAGEGVVREERLYQLIRGGGDGERSFEIEFLDPGVRAFAFTFG
ncbi:MAG: cytochrome c biogenesis protein DipZ [Hyphomonadaceae bacterium]|nr:cytochrome c biogenesis protein DipZ [Hyphomonadaceae bacterium]